MIMVRTTKPKPRKIDRDGRRVLDDLLDTFSQLDAVKGELEKLKARKEELEQQVRDALDGTEEGAVNGVTVVTNKTGEYSEFDQSSFKAKHPVIAKRFIVFKSRTTMLIKFRAFGEAKIRG